MDPKMAKYFEAPTLEEAQQQAADYFSCTLDSLMTEVVQEGHDAVPWLLLALCIPFELRSQAEHRNGQFRLFYEEKGVFLELVAPRGEGIPVDRNEVLVTLKRKALTGLLGPEVSNLIESGAGRARIAPPQQENILGEEPLVQVAADGLTAELTILPPEEGGAVLTFGDLRSAVTGAGVTFGIDESSLGKLADHKIYNTPVTVASGIPPVDGVDGVVLYHFEEADGKPAEDGLGRVDYRSLSLFVPVEEGQLLVSRTLATPGEPGMTIKGKPIKQRMGREARMPRSKNTVANDDQTTLHAQRSGFVELAGGVVQVQNVYVVRQDVDMGIGNIDFDGSVQIEGGVIAGMSIKAAGSIVVGGVVEGSELTAGGNIELKRGIQGADKGVLTAGGSISAIFVERATLSAGENIYADTIIHSTLEAGGALVLNGKRGSVVGGVSLAGREIAALTVGAESGTRTELAVGFPPLKRARIESLEQEVARIDEELEKLARLDFFLTKAAEAGDSSKQATHESVKESILRNRINREGLGEELRALTEELRNAVDGKVHIKATIHPGSRVSIGSSVYRVESPIQFATFSCQQGDVIFGPCEV